MVYQIDLQDLESLNHLIFDASVEYNDLKKLNIHSPIELKLERRCFENVKRKRFLFWSSTTLGGKTSLIRLHGVKEIVLTGIDDTFKDNHFINEVVLNSPNNSLEIRTVFGLRVIFIIGSDFRGELVDIGDSNFGAGSLFGTKGFTKKEWENRNK